MANTATRLITLVMLLQRQPNQTATQLGATLGVSVRTVQRYMTMLDDMGIPIYAERGPHGGYALVRGYKMPPLIFTPEEAVAVALGTRVLEEVWGRLYQEAAQGALAKLDNVLPDDQRREVAWARQALRSTGMRWGDPNLVAPYLETLRDAIRDRRRVRLIYRGRSQAPSQRDLDPYTLFHGWGSDYCIGYCHLRQDIRFFRVDRMLKLVLLDETFEAPTDFDIQAHLATDPYFQRRMETRLCFAPEVALLAHDKRGFWDTLEEQPDGSIVVTFETPDLETAASIVLGHGYPATIVEPAALRDLVRERAEAIVAQYAANAI